MTLQARLRPKFPARVVASTGMRITKAGGVYTFAWDISDFAELVTLPDPDQPNLFVPVWNSVTEQYRITSLETLIDSITNLFGSVVGPGTATDNAIARYDLTTGQLLQDSAIIISDAGHISPSVNDASSLGTSALKFSDLFLAAGAVVNFNSGNATITHATNKVTIGGAGGSVIDFRINGADSTFIGKNAGLTNNTPVGTDGTYNTFVGSQSGQNNASGYACAFFGYNSGYSNTTGTTNTFLGYQTGQANTTGSSNVFVGVDAGYGNVSGDGSVIMGFHAGLNLNPASGQGRNVIIGYESAIAASSANDCAFLGYRTGYGNTAANGTFLGAYAGFTNTSGASNTFVGFNAGFFNSTAAGNTYIGARAGETATGSGNVFLGNLAGFYETGSSKLFIDNTNRTNEADARVKALVYGIFNASVASQKFTVNGQLIGNGTGTNDNAAAGVIGEEITGPTAFPGTSLVTSTSKTVCSVALTAGDWEVEFSCTYEPAGTTNVTNFISSISATNNTLDTTQGKVTYFSTAAQVPAGALTFNVKTRVSLAAGATYYGVGRSTFTVSTMTAWGMLRARRLR